MSKAVLRLGTCGAHMGILPESTDSLKTFYFSRESTFRAAWLARGVEVFTYSLNELLSFVLYSFEYKSCEKSCERDLAVESTLETRAQYI
mgnify:CR=1 FL=1